MGVEVQFGRYQASFSIFLLTKPECIYNPISAMGFLQCLLFSWTTLRGKHCWHPIAVTGLVDTFGLRLAFHRFVHHGYSRIIIQNIVTHLENKHTWLSIYLGFKRCQNKYIPPQRSSSTNKCFVVITTGFTIMGILYTFWYKNFGPGSHETHWQRRN